MAELERLATLLASVSDVLAERVTTLDEPSWARERQWTKFLLGLSDDDVTAAERDGLWQLERCSAEPDDLARLCDTARRELCPLTHGPEAPACDEHRRSTQRVPERKRAQIAAMLHTLARSGSAGGFDRVVDIGAGHGHFARAAARSLGVVVVGIDYDPARIAVARRLAGGGGATHPVRFIEGSADSVKLTPRDLVVGLHACGAFGDALLHEASEAGARVLLVSCCQQKIPVPERLALSAQGRSLDLRFSRKLLGLSNLAWGADVSRNMFGRQTRHALQLLLRSRGVEESIGEIPKGVHRKRFLKGLAAVAPAALERRGLAAPDATEIEHFEQQGAQAFHRIRRFSLPRNMLGRLLELTLVHDRARFLEERGYEAHIRAAFDTDVSPRNLAIVAERR